MLSDTRFFGTEHPIVCLAMNGVSDANLAIAVSKAGALPSLSLPNYMRDMGRALDVDFVNDVSCFCEKAGTSNILISLTDLHLAEHYDFLYRVFKQFGITHIELIIMSMGDSFYAENSDSVYLQRLQELQSLGIRITVKSITFPYNTIHRFSITEPLMDGLLIKGSEGAGKINSHKDPASLLWLSLLAKRKHPDKAIVPSGGISTAEQIKNYMMMGCAAVGIGTLFALSEESRIAKNSKLDIIANNRRQLEKLECEGTVQNAFVFEKFEGEDNSNHSISLKLGTEGKGGHLFVGKGISEVNEILPVSEIVARLMS